MIRRLIILLLIVGSDLLDDELDVLDVVVMVDIIMSGGMGDVGYLLNIVKG